MSAPTPRNEVERLGALRRYRVLDSAEEAAFDRITRLASVLLEAPVALISLIDEDRQWLKSCVGIEASQTTRDVAFCAHAILSDEVTVVTDATQDPRFSDNPFVTGPPGIRFYVGAPLRSPEGFNLGTLCVADTVSRPRPEPERLQALTDLAAIVVSQLELRLKTLREGEEADVRSALAAIVESSDDAILGKSLDGTIRSWNRGAERLYGYRAEEVVGRSITILVPGDHRDDEVERILARIRRGEKVDHYETRRVRKDGAVIEVSLTVSPIRNEDGEIVGASTIARDMGERKQLEAAMQTARDKAMEVARVKSHFLATMSHEIRTPMNGVVGMTGLLLDTDLSPEQREYAETVRSSAESLLAVINDILDFSKIEAGKLDLEIIDFDLRTVVEEVADLLAELAHRRGLELATLVQPDVPSAVRGDPGRLRQVLLNLMGNAIKFTERGEVVVRAHTVQDGGDEVVVRFDVADTGIGIAPERLGDVFASFSQADASTTRRYGGTGLGLAICKQLVELMGGEIGVDSRLGEGSTFWFTVRLGKAGPTSAVVPVTGAALRGLPVLVVDDNATSRTILEQSLLAWGMRPTSACDATQAMEMLRAARDRGQPYPLAILDYDMPDMDGIELARAIADEGMAAKLVLLTSRAERGDARTAAAAGIHAYLTKPVRQSALRDVISIVMGVHEPKSPAPLVTRHTIAEARARSRARVLIADDNPVNQKVAARMLEKIGHRVDVAGNGLEAVEAVARIPYAAVLMDCQMPEMDGFEATREIRKLPGGRGSIPVIALTAGAMKADEESCREAGMDDFVAKPVTTEKLAEVLERWIPPADAGALDASVLAGLRELHDGDDVLSDLLTAFLENTESRLESLRLAVGRGDPETVIWGAHAIRGASGAVGALGLAAVCGELEQVAAEGGVPPAGMVERAAAEFRRVVNALRGEISRGGRER